MFNEFGYVIFLLLVLPYIESASRRRLNEYISHYEQLSYDALATHRSHLTHLRTRRSVAADAADLSHRVPIDFDAHGRTFRIRLRRETSAFSDDLKVEGPGGILHNVDTSHLYHGELIDEPDSAVFGALRQGVFEGKIISPNDGAFYVEHAGRYQQPIAAYLTNTSIPHSVIYRDGDVEDPYAHRRHGHVGGCGITDDVVQWMERIQNSAVDEEIPPPSAPSPQPVHHRQHQRTPNSIIDDRPQFDSEYYAPHAKYSWEANNGGTDDFENDSRGPRLRRAARSKDDYRNTCSLFIQTDPLIWRHVRSGFPDHRDESKRAKVDEKTREEILSLIAHHVTAVNYIYRDTKFDGRLEHRNIKFEVQRIKIDDDSACNTNQYAGEINQFCLENIDVSNFLNLHSLANHEDFCLAYVFTYRDFTGGTLGLAWVASASGASGGICEKYKTYTETIGGMYQSTKRSLNTGIITFVNYNSRVPPKVSQLTLAHEIGHNFGSPHDYPTQCRPGGQAGNYIMFASATSGDRPNNSRFSNCSVANISAVLDAVREGRKRNCFTASAGAFCGNKIVEAGEECDCGYDEAECNDKCCYPRSVSEADKSNNASAMGCHRRYNTQCSPSQGPCCSGETCRFVPGTRGHTCRSASQCAKAAACDGYSARCPTAKPLPDKTRCNNGTQLCINGECFGSICLEWNMTECFLSSTALIGGDGGAVAARSSAVGVIDRRALCQLACQIGNDPLTCRSTADFAANVGLPLEGISLRPGSPCDNFQGYCDVFLKCRAVDAEGPLARLKNLLLNKQTLMSVASWVTEHWWAVLLGGVLLVCCMGAFVKCCAVHTPSSNPKQPPARRLSETLRRPMNTLRRMRHPHGRAAAAMSASPAGASAAPPRQGRSSRSAAAHRPPAYQSSRGQSHALKAGSAAPAGRRTDAYPPSAGHSGHSGYLAHAGYEMRAPHKV